MSIPLTNHLTVSDGGVPLWHWSPVTSNDQTGVGWVIGLMAMTSVLLATFLRLTLKKFALRPDDASIGAAVLLYVFQLAAFFVSLDEGLGKEADLLSDSERYKAFHAAFASDVLAIVVHYTAKASMALLVYGLFKGNKAMFNTRLCEALLALIAGSALLSVVVLLSATGEVAHVGINGTISTASRWDVVFAFDVLTELALAGVPIYLILTILKKNKQKFVVCSVFLLRLPVLAFSALHLARLNTLEESPSAAGPALLNCESVLQILLAWSIVSASLPALKSLAQPFDVIKGHGVSSGYGGDRYAGSSTTRAAGGFFYGPGGKA